jgi:hypothetical protein
MSITKARGSCFCGAVEYEFELPSKFVAHCHCSECRRTGGSPFVTWIGTWDDKLRVLKGSDALSTFDFSDAPRASRQFCRVCGSQLFFRCETWPKEVHVTRATVSSEVDRAVQAHVFYSDRAGWYDANDDLPKLGGPTGVEKL